MGFLNSKPQFVSLKRKTVTGYLAALTFILAAVALQLYFNKDHYFAMNRAKCSFTMIVLIGAAATLLAGPVERLWGVRQERQKMVLLDWCVLVFGCSSIVTCLLSQAPQMTFVGVFGMFVGGFSYFTGMLVYFVVSRNLIPSRWIVCTLVAAWAVIFLWTIVNQCGIDVFGMHEGMNPGDFTSHVSSMGNVNSASDAFATLVPFIMILLLMSTDITDRFLLAAVCFIGLLASFALGCEGVLIGFVAVIPFVVLTALTDVGKVNRTVRLLQVAGLALSLYHFLCINGVIPSSGGIIYKVAGLWTGELLTVLSIILLLMLGNGRMKFTDRSLKNTRTALVWTFVAVFVGFVAISVIKSFHDINYGSARGAVWKGSVWSFRLYNPVEMIFGKGSGMFAKGVTLAYSMLFDKEPDVSYATCHNSLLQALLGNGIIGLLCLLTGLFALLRDWFRELRHIVLRPMPKYESLHYIQFDEKVRVASFVSIVGYFGASMVESTYPHTVLLLFAMLALYRSSFFVPRQKLHTRESFAL